MLFYFVKQFIRFSSIAYGFCELIPRVDFFGFDRNVVGTLYFFKNVNLILKFMRKLVIFVSKSLHHINLKRFYLHLDYSVIGRLIRRKQPLKQRLLLLNGIGFKETLHAEQFGMLPC